MRAKIPNRKLAAIENKPNPRRIGPKPGFSGIS